MASILVWVNREGLRTRGGRVGDGSPSCDRSTRGISNGVVLRTTEVLEGRGCVIDAIRWDDEFGSGG